MTWRRQVATVSIVALLVTPTFLPYVLAFPYKATSGPVTVRSETPIDQGALDKVVAKRNALVAASPLAKGAEPRNVYLTHGGWRWKWLALTAGDAFAVSKPLSESIIMNRADLATDSISNDRAVGSRRSLSGTIAHETCHGMERAHFGIQVDWNKPAWLREGYCDHVAQESALSDADAAKLKAAHQQHPALLYYDGRKKVETTLARNGGNVDALFAAN